MSLSIPLQQVAQSLRCRMSKPLRTASAGFAPAPQWHRVVSDADEARSVARYLAQHLRLSDAERHAFVQACGIGGLVN